MLRWLGFSRITSPAIECPGLHTISAEKNQCVPVPFRYTGSAHRSIGCDPLVFPSSEKSRISLQCRLGPERYLLDTPRSVILCEVLDQNMQKQTRCFQGWKLQNPLELFASRSSKQTPGRRLHVGCSKSKFRMVFLPGELRSAASSVLLLLLLHTEMSMLSFCIAKSFLCMMGRDTWLAVACD